MANPLTVCLFPIQNVMTAGVRRRIGVGVALLVVAIAPPLFGFQALLGPNVFTMVMFGIEVAVLNTLFGDIWLGLLVSLVYLLFLPVSVVSGSIPIAGACLMALASIGMGVSTKYRRFGGFYAVPLGMAFVMTIPPSVAHTFTGDPAKIHHLLVFVGATAAACLWSAIGTHFMVGSIDIPLTATIPKAESVRYTVVMTFLITIATWWVLSYGINDHGVWLILTLLIVLQVDRQTSRHKIVQRTGGTVVGALVAAALTGFGEPQWFVTSMLVLMLVGMAATVGREPYALFVFFLTNVVLLGLPSGVVGASVDRLLFTLLGVGLALCVVILEGLFFPDPAPTSGGQPAAA